MSGKQKVLLVEDDADVRRLYAIGLNQRGYEVKLAANGAEAIDRLAIERPDFILLDWLMPLMDGSEVVARLATTLGDIEIIVVSGQPAPAVLPGHVRAWLTKPVTVDDLVIEMNRETNREMNRTAMNRSEIGLNGITRSPLLTVRH